ncbi:MAG: PD-(D/E)XK motif protein [Spirochaetia bacterium]|nr:PD-(D/E)XK motif protein [Spirochaetia bacterium]
MSLLNKITDAINTFPEDNKLYLIEKCSDVAGFFSCNKKLIYMAKNIEFVGSNSLQTEYLKLQSNVSVISVENLQTFNSGFYNLIEYKISFNENISAFESFINLCLAHIELMDSKNFVEFFNSLIDLFQNVGKEKKHNILGLFGELSLIYYFYTKFSINLSSYWHTSGTYSKYDFSLKNKNIEVKTSNSVNNVLIKHSQLFNNDSNYLAISIVENNNSGISLKELEEKLKDIDIIASDFNFIVTLEKEKSRLDTADYSNKKLKLLDINIYDCNIINPFNTLPENISDIEYRIDLLSYAKIKNEDIKYLLDL